MNSNEIDIKTSLAEILLHYPQCMEFLWPMKQHIADDETIESIATKMQTSSQTIYWGMKRCMKRAEQYPCNYEEMRRQLVKPNAVNIAGFVNFVWEKEFIELLQAYATANKIELNLNIFPKHRKKEFQNYLALCAMETDLPDILIGKGFSSLCTKRFIDLFVLSNVYQHKLAAEPLIVRPGFELYDQQFHYHPFAVEEYVMVFDQNVDTNLPAPASWSDLLLPHYCDAVTQMGKDERDNFGFVSLFYLHAQAGNAAIAQFAHNVKQKQHFARIVKNMSGNSEQKTAINIMHAYANKFIRGEVQTKLRIIEAKDGNPVTAYFFLLKQNASAQSQKMALYLYSQAIAQLLAKSGAIPVAATTQLHHQQLRWIGWNNIKNSSLPFFKEHLSDIAFESYDKKHKNKI